MGGWFKGVSDNQSLHTVPAATIGTSAVHIAAAALAPGASGSLQGLTLQADPGNAGTIYVGDSTVTTSNGIALAAGASLTVPVFDPYSIYAVASTTAQVLRIAYV